MSVTREGNRGSRIGEVIPSTSRAHGYSVSDKVKTLNMGMKMVVPEHVVNQINIAHEMCPRGREWSGAIIFDLEGTLNDPKNIKITAVGIYVCDIGTATYTEFEMHKHIDKLNEEYDMIKKPNRYYGELHTHHNMSTFFSNTDERELYGHCHIFSQLFYLSMIVNYKDPSHWICRAATPVKEIVTSPKVSFENGSVIHSGHSREEEYIASWDVEMVFPKAKKADPFIEAQMKELVESREKARRLLEEKRAKEAERSLSVKGQTGYKQKGSTSRGGSSARSYNLTKEEITSLLHERAFARSVMMKRLLVGILTDILPDNKAKKILEIDHVSSQLDAVTSYVTKIKKYDDARLYDPIDKNYLIAVSQAYGIQLYPEDPDVDLLSLIHDAYRWVSRKVSIGDHDNLVHLQNKLEDVAPSLHDFQPFLE